MCGRPDVTLSTADFHYLCRLLHDGSANTLSDGKQYLVETRLEPLARQEGFASVSELVGQLRAGSAALRREVIEAMVNNETFFFRDVHPFDALRREILPDLLRANPGRRLSMWSAATSTGQEAFSLALLLHEHFRGVPATVLGTDLSAKVLDRARTGRFSQLEVNRGLPASMLVRHFDRDGVQWQLHDDVRGMVTFRQLNLAGPLRGVGPMDVILLRNLLIYFDVASRIAVLSGLAQILRPDGYLFLGSAETTYGLPVPYERVQIGHTTCYRLTEPATMGATGRNNQ